jgi:hypothetical protein
MAKHLSTEELDAGLDQIRQSPADAGVLQLIAQRPQIGERVLPEAGQLDVDEGLVGDNWKTRGQSQEPPRQPNPETQVTIMNSRSAHLVSDGDKDRWPLAGDQLYVDLNIGPGNLPAGTRLRIGSATLEVTAEPHTGCKKFVERFGMDAMTWVNSPEGKQLCLRGINTKVVESGAIKVGDTVSKA